MKTDEPVIALDKYHFDLWQKQLDEKDAEIERLKKIIERQKEAMEILLDHVDDECRFDHNRNCQNHGYLDLFGEECPVAIARQCLKEVQEIEGA
jgi:hypothetical protein